MRVKKGIAEIKNLFDLTGKVAIVTGGSGGFGRAAAGKGQPYMMLQEPAYGAVQGRARDLSLELLSHLHALVPEWDG